MSHKSEVITCFKDYVAKSEAHFNQKIVHLYCDNGREYLSGETREFCKQKRITFNGAIHSPTKFCGGTYEQNIDRKGACNGAQCRFK
jgi:hypothetical protein